MTTMDRIIEPRDTTGDQRTATSGQRTATHHALAVIALVAGLLAAMSGTPYRAQSVGALELAQWIHDHKPGLCIVDIRDAAAFADYHLPRSERVTTLVAPKRGETLVIIDDVRTTNNEQRTTDNGQPSANSNQRAAIRELRGRDIYYLRGGVGEWLADVMSPTQPSELTRYFGGQPRAGGGAPQTAHTILRRGC
jgi:hypothetical protein